MDSRVVRWQKMEGNVRATVVLRHIVRPLTAWVVEAEHAVYDALSLLEGLGFCAGMELPSISKNLEAVKERNP